MTRTMPSNEPEGLLPVDKPAGPTSHDVVSAARRALGTRRIGHTGTLDPFASGLLLLLVGRATRLAEYFDPLAKRYEAVMRLGEGTDTDDRTGAITARAEVQGLQEAGIRSALEGQTGVRMQRPPAFSAKKVDGERAYAAARQGRALDLEPVPVRIDSVRVKRVELPDVWFEVTCGAGTYIRAIARDAGVELGVPAHLLELRRTGIGPWTVDDALAMPDLDRGPDALRTPVDAVAHLARVEVDAEAARRLARGLRLPAPGDAPDGTVAVLSEGALVAIATVADGSLAPRKVFANA